MENNVDTVLTTGTAIGGVELADQIPEENLKLIVQLLIGLVGLLRLVINFKKNKRNGGSNI